MREEAVEAATWLGCEVPSCLTVEVQGVGEGSTTGTTRGKISEARHVMRGNMLVRGLEEHPRQHRDNRPVWAWLQRDKLSSAWLQALPGPDSTLPSSPRGPPLPCVSPPRPVWTGWASQYGGGWW